MGAMEIAWYGGFMIAFLIGHLLSEYTDLSWHFILGTSTFIAVALFLARLGLPESPRWLWSVGRKDEARALAAKYMPDDALTTSSTRTFARAASGCCSPSSTGGQRCSSRGSGSAP